MATLTIVPERVKVLRNAHKIGRSKFAKLTGMTERQIAKLEAGDAGDATISEDVAARIAAVLHIPVPALTGELPLVADDLTPPSAPKCTSGCCG